jgi:cytochrome c oxidase assembly protein subunit 15
MEMGSILTAGTFKFIYFWEWVHRLWARVMGIVFLVPFIIFWSKGMFDKMLKWRLLVVFLLAGLAASFGWIMVASGLIERPWVNAYKLALHLSIAFLTYSYLLWTFFKTQWPSFSKQSFGLQLRFNRIARWFTILLCVQIFLGGVMSGMRAAVTYPTWPDMNGAFLPSVLFDSQSWTMYNFNYYDQHLFMPALIQSVHRLVAYCLVLFAIYLLPRIIRGARDTAVRSGGWIVVGLLSTQFLLGILTVINSKTSIPVGYGVAHQIVALFLLTACLHLNYRFRLGGNVSRGTLP